MLAARAEGVGVSLPPLAMTSNAVDARAGLHDEAHPNPVAPAAASAA